MCIGEFKHTALRDTARGAVLLSWLLWTAGCRTVDVSSRLDATADFGRFQTFNFAETAPPNSSPQISLENWKQIQSAVADEMTRRSYQVSSSPDLQIVIRLGTAAKSYNKSNPSVESGSIGANLGRHYGLVYDPNLGTEPEVSYTEGTLLFQALDTQQQRPVWEGTAVGVLHGNRTPAQVQERIREAVGRVFAKFPQGRKGP